MESEKTIGKLIEILTHQLSMLKDSATLFDVGQTIGMASGLFLRDEDNWRKEDLEWGTKYGLGWKDGTSDDVIRDFEYHKKIHETTRNVQRLIELNKQLKELEENEGEEIEKLSHLLKSQNLILITKNDNPETYQDENDFRNIDNAPDRYTTR